MSSDQASFPPIIAPSRYLTCFILQVGFFDATPGSVRLIFFLINLLLLLFNSLWFGDKGFCLICSEQIGVMIKGGGSWLENIVVNWKKVIIIAHFYLGFLCFFLAGLWWCFLLCQIDDSLFLGFFFTLFANDAFLYQISDLPFF